MGSVRPPFVVPGAGPIVLVAPHAGRRDARRRPWGGHPLKVNDLHTGPLTEVLAHRLGAAAVINPGIDRNDVDLNRVSAAHALLPEFLGRLADLLEATVARHGHATLLAVHGWNVVQPAVDVGLGCVPATDPLHVGPDAAVTPAFARAGVGSLLAACAARGIEATVGARYPARARENLLQLFTPRYRADARPLLRRLAALAPTVNAVQLELALPLRLPGPWRERMEDALVAASSALAGTAAPSPDRLAVAPGAPPLARRTVEFTSAAWSGMIATDATGARVLLFPPDGGLWLFTAEHTGAPLPLAVDVTGGALRIRYDGPLVRFPDTTPFLDLEDGLARAAVAQARFTLDVAPEHADADGVGDFAHVAGTLVVADRRHRVAARGWTETAADAHPWPRLRARVRTRAGALALTTSPGGGSASGFLCAAGRHDRFDRAEVGLLPSPADVRAVEIVVRPNAGEAIAVRAVPVHRLPVVRGGLPAPVRLLFATCMVDGSSEPAGWIELGGI